MPRFWFSFLFWIFIFKAFAAVLFDDLICKVQENPKLRSCRSTDVIYALLPRWATKFDLSILASTTSLKLFWESGLKMTYVVPSSLCSVKNHFFCAFLDIWLIADKSGCQFCFHLNVSTIPCTFLIVGLHTYLTSQEECIWWDTTHCFVGIEETRTMSGEWERNSFLLEVVVGSVPVKPFFRDFMQWTIDPRQHLGWKIQFFSKPESILDAVLSFLAVH